MNPVALHYERKGEGAPVLLVHGVGSRSDDWQAAGEVLADRFDVIRCDLRGHGQSPAPDGEWSIVDFSNDICHLLDRLGLEKVSLAGFSLGGLIAQRFALDHPDRLNRLSLICATTGRTAAQKQKALERLERLRTVDTEDYIEQSLSRWFTPEFIRARADVMQHKSDLIRALDKDAYIRAYRVLIDTNHADELHRIGARTLIIAAQNDIGSPPSMSEAMHAAIADSHLIVLPRLKHSILLEAPAIVGGLLREFFVLE